LVLLDRHARRWVSVRPDSKTVLAAVRNKPDSSGAPQHSVLRRGLEAVVEQVCAVGTIMVFLFQPADAGRSPVAGMHRTRH
jgi:hypothetical protein